MRREYTFAELEEQDRINRSRIGRQDAFDHGKPATILRYWESGRDPDNEELRVIVRNILHMLEGLT